VQQREVVHELDGHGGGHGGRGGQNQKRRIHVTKRYPWQLTES